MLRMTVMRLAPAAVLAAVALPAAAQIASVEVLRNLDRPLRLVAPAGDPRLFVVERAGVVLVFDHDGTFRDTCLDLRDEVSLGVERGLLGLAFPPDHAATGRLYVSYTDPVGDSRLVRYTMGSDPDRADPASAEPLLLVDQPDANHNGGHIEFGPDGMLYLGLGDGGGSGDPDGNAQDDQSLLGKLLRLDVSGPGGYAIPPDNPFVGQPPRDEIWAKGLRNPWCWSFDRQTGDLYIADVGQNELEEIDVQPAASAGGGNYGWNVMEGSACYDPPVGCVQTGLILPVHEYGHGGSPFRCSVTGGYVYRGAAVPSLAGRYFFADFCSAQVWSLTWLPGQGAADVQDWTAQIAPPGGFGAIAGFGQDGLGELYVLDYERGTAHRLTSGVNAVPAAPAPHLAQNVPNPFNPSTVIRFELPRAARVALGVYDARGRLVRTLVDGAAMPAGGHEAAWDGRDAHGRSAAAGVYVYVLEAGESRQARRMVLVR